MPDMREHPRWCPVYAKRTPMIPFHNGVAVFRWRQPDGSVTVEQRPCLGCGATECADCGEVGSHADSCHSAPCPYPGCLGTADGRSCRHPLPED